jgi:hypothetical protein
MLGNNLPLSPTLASSKELLGKACATCPMDTCGGGPPSHSPRAAQIGVAAYGGSHHGFLGDAGGLVNPIGSIGSGGDAQHGATMDS